MWQAWVNFVIGLIIFIVALFVPQAPNWIYWLGGLIVAVLSIWQALSKK